MFYKFFMLTLLFCGTMMLCGCQNIDNRMPSEDIEVPVKYSDIITILKDPHLSANSKEKYEAAKDLIKVVDLTFTREIKTVNDLFYHGDAAIDSPHSEERTVMFNFQYQNEYVRLMFVTLRNFVLRTSVICTENSMRKYETEDAVKLRGIKLRK